MKLLRMPMILEDFDVYVTKFYRDLEFYGIYKQKPYKQIIKFSELDKLEETTYIHGKLWF